MDKHENLKYSTCKNKFLASLNRFFIFSRLWKIIYISNNISYMLINIFICFFMILLLLFMKYNHYKMIHYQSIILKLNFHSFYQKIHNLKFIEYNHHIFNLHLRNHIYPYLNNNQINKPLQLIL
jgi:hypothetical protein